MGVLKLEELVRELSNSLAEGATPEKAIARVSEILRLSPAEITGGIESLDLVIARCLVIEGYMSLGEKPSYEAIATALQRPVSTVRTLHQQLRKGAGMPEYCEDAQRHFPTIAELLHACKKGTPPLMVINYVAQSYGVDPEEVRNGNKRRRHITPARHLAMYILRENLGLSLQAVAAYFDKGPAMTHTTVRLATEKISRFLKEKGLEVQISVVEEELFSSDAEKRELEQRLPDGEQKGSHGKLVQDYLAWRLNAKVRELVARPELKITDLVPEMARHTGLSVDKITAARRSPYPAVRAACCAVVRERFEGSYEFCGELFGGKDHSTVMYYFDQLRTAGLVPEDIVTPEDSGDGTRQPNATVAAK